MPESTTKATLHTSMGDINVILFPDQAPKTVRNFVGLAEGTQEWTDPQARTKTTKPLYDGTVFHRIIPGFMIQGGDPLGSGMGGPGYRFNDELPKAGQYEIGSLAMANAGPNTNGSQFFLISGPDGVRLPPAYALFGKVVKGLEVVEAMQNVPTGPGDRPHTDVVINSVTITVAD